MPCGSRSGRRNKKDGLDSSRRIVKVKGQSGLKDNLNIQKAAASFLQEKMGLDKDDMIEQLAKDLAQRIFVQCNPT